MIYRTTACALSLTALCSAQNWFQIKPTTSPSARTGHAMAYDSVRQRTVLFGGVGVSGLLGLDVVPPKDLQGHARGHAAGRGSRFGHGGGGRHLSLDGVGRLGRVGGSGNRDVRLPREKETQESGAHRSAHDPAARAFST